MSVTIRLAKVGRKNAPAYKIVVANTRDKRNGRFLDVLGHYNPSHKPETFAIDQTKYQEWVAKGAITSATVTKLRDGKYTFKPYKPHASKDTGVENSSEA